MYKVFSKCDELVSDYCFDNNLHRKQVAQEMGLSPKQLNNILSGEVEGCFDIIISIFAKCLGESALEELFQELLNMINEREEYVTAKNLFAMYELSIIISQKGEYINNYLNQLLKNVKLTKAIKQTIQIIFVIEKMFTFDSMKDFNFQSSSINAEYAKMFQPLESKEISTGFSTFLEFCINMRRNERIAGFYYCDGNYEKAAEIYEMLYELPSGKDNRRYLGYKLLQSLAESKNDEKFKNVIKCVMQLDKKEYDNYLNWYLENQYYNIKEMSTLLQYWFTRNKEQLILKFEEANDIFVLSTTKLFLTNLTESCSYIM
ncbi:MAG: hypothetical protein ACRCV7_06410 [Culicoidibacterales bacterium]